MNAEAAASPEKPDVLAGGRFDWLTFAIWLPASALLGGLGAWVAVEGQFYFAPLLLFPILVGIGVGAMNVGLMRLAQMGNRQTAVLGAVVAAAVAVCGQHYLDYRHDAAAIQQRNDAVKGAPALLLQDLPQPPASLAEYMRRQAAEGRPLGKSVVLKGWAAWTSWGVDALLVLAASLLMVIPATRQPYCNKCRSWYRTIRGGRIPLATAQRLAPEAMAIDEKTMRSRYRLTCCQGGCSPTRLEMFWENGEGAHLSIQRWLDAEGRNRVLEELDKE